MAVLAEVRFLWYSNMQFSLKLCLRGLVFKSLLCFFLKGCNFWIFSCLTRSDLFLVQVQSVRLCGEHTRHHLHVIYDAADRYLSTNNCTFWNRRCLHKDLKVNTETICWFFTQLKTYVLNRSLLWSCSLGEADIKMTAQASCWKSASTNPLHLSCPQLRYCDYTPQKISMPDNKHSLCWRQTIQILLI